jgi:hypothetical protein
MLASLILQGPMKIDYGWSGWPSILSSFSFGSTFKGDRKIERKITLLHCLLVIFFFFSVSLSISLFLFYLLCRRVNLNLLASLPPRINLPKWPIPIVLKKWEIFNIKRLIENGGLPMAIAQGPKPMEYELKEKEMESEISRSYQGRAREAFAGNKCQPLTQNFW